MKKMIIMGILLLLVLSGAYADSLSIDTEHFDARVAGLGTAYTALADDSNALYLNPAGLRRQYGNTMSIRLDIQDSINGDILSGEPMTGIFENPELEGEFLYTSRNWGIAAYSKYFMDIETTDEEYLFNVGKFNSLVFGLSTGLGPISLGANIKATKYDYKNNPVEFPKEEPISLIIPFIQEVILNDYNSSDPDENVSMGVGALLDIGNFSLGVYSDQFLDFMYGDDSEIKLDLDNIVKGLDVGIAYQSDNYDKFGNYRVFQFTLAADVHDLGDDDNRIFAMGSETNLRLFEYMQLAIRLGYQQEIEEIDDLLFGISMVEGDYSVGIGAILPFMKFDAAATIPAEAIIQMIDSEDSYTGDRIAAQLTFGFAL